MPPLTFAGWCAGLNRIQIVGSMNPATTVGRHQLSPRFTALVRTAYIGYPPVAQLQMVYGSMLEQVLRKVSVGLLSPSVAALDLATGKQQEPSPCADHSTCPHASSGPRNW